MSQCYLPGSLRHNRCSSGDHRQFSARPQKVLNYEDLVRDTIKKMIAERDEGQHTKGIADEVLQRRFQHYQVRSCVCSVDVFNSVVTGLSFSQADISLFQNQ